MTFTCNVILNPNLFYFILNQQFIIYDIITDYSSYNITTYIKEKRREKEERKKEKKKIKINCQDLIIEELLLSDSFIEGKCSRVKLKENNEVIKRLSIEILVIIISPTLMKDIIP